MVNFASAALPHELTGVSPFFIEQGYEPRTLFDWETREPLPEPTSVNRQEAREMAARIQEGWEYAKTGIQAAQHRMTQAANQKRRDEVFQVGERVMITTRDWNLGRPSRKLGNQMAGPYKVVEKIGNAYRLLLPANLRVHPMFSPDKL